MFVANCGDFVELTNISSVDNEQYTIPLQMSYSEFIDSFTAWQNGVLIQHAFPKLSPVERDFIKFGITPEQAARIDELENAMD